MDKLGLLDIILRLAMAMLVGVVVGGQRARTGHPAGLRTHMLVSLGACVVMITSCLLYQDTVLHYSATPSDPARLGAQVISGVGFLGAGAIIRDGFSVRGLTTAASLWAVACMGLAAGMGYVTLTLCGTVAIFLTLCAFTSVQRFLRTGHRPEIDMTIECEDLSAAMLSINELAEHFFATLTNLNFQRTGQSTYVISFRTLFPPRNFKEQKSAFLQKAATIPGLINMEHDQERNA